MVAPPVAALSSQGGSLVREIVNRVLGVPELVASLAGLRREKKLRLRIVVLRDHEGRPVVSEDELTRAVGETRSVLAREAGVTLAAVDGTLVVTLEEPAPPRALDAPCAGNGLWKTDLGPAGDYFRAHLARHPVRTSVGLGAPLTVFVVRDVVGKCGCSLGPLGDYVTIEPRALRDGSLRILAHELGHSCGLGHRGSETNLMRARGQGERLTRWQRAVLRSSRHVTYL